MRHLYEVSFRKRKQEVTEALEKRSSRNIDVGACDRIFDSEVDCRRSILAP